jgi:hypothetical protein
LVSYLWPWLFMFCLLYCLLCNFSYPPWC